jgi:hypothetical protein
MMRKPPAAATWLLRHLGPIEKHESLAGDLDEQFHRGRLAGWYWRQTVRTVAAHQTEMLVRYWSVAIAAVAVDASLSTLYLSYIWHWTSAVDSAWQPHLMHRLLAAQNMTVFDLGYGMTTGLTTQMVWCGLVSCVAWIFVRLRPEARQSIVALLVTYDIGRCIPGLFHEFSGWSRHPTDLAAVLMAVRFALFTFVGIPASIFIAGRAGSRHRLLQVT